MFVDGPCVYSTNLKFFSLPSHTHSQTTYLFAWLHLLIFSESALSTLISPGYTLINHPSPPQFLLKGASLGILQHSIPVVTLDFVYIYASPHQIRRSLSQLFLYGAMELLWTCSKDPNYANFAARFSINVCWAWLYRMRTNINHNHNKISDSFQFQPDIICASIYRYIKAFRLNACLFIYHMRDHRTILSAQLFGTIWLTALLSTSK